MKSSKFISNYFCIQKLKMLIRIRVLCLVAVFVLFLVLICFLHFQIDPFHFIRPVGNVCVRTWLIPCLFRSFPFDDWINAWPLLDLLLFIVSRKIDTFKANCTHTYTHTCSSLFALFPWTWMVTDCAEALGHVFPIGLFYTKPNCLSMPVPQPFTVCFFFCLLG